MTLLCVECGSSWDDPLERWRLLRTDDEPAETAFYCPECAEREFGE